MTLIAEAVFARSLSAMKEERVAASSVLAGPDARFEGDREAFVEDVRQALYAAKIVSYAQGYMLMREAANEYGWNLNYGGIALMWRGGCIIRSAFLGKIKEAFDTDTRPAQPAARRLLQGRASTAASPPGAGSSRRPCSSASRFPPSPPRSRSTTATAAARLPANLLQAQRDYFGAHTYERVDKPRGQFFHTNWTGTGGKVASSSYNA